MLAHIMDRLLLMTELQQREMSLLDRGAGFEWWREVAKDMDGSTGRPDPNRWHEPAMRYKDATEAFCRGDLERGTQQMQRAMDTEHAVFDATTSLVSTADLAANARPDTNLLDGLMNKGQVGACEAAEQMDLANGIIALTANPPLTPDLRPTATPWWAKEDEETPDDAEDDEDGGG
jgi:hypothetical protein